jgi:hypothetical protein
VAVPLVMEVLCWEPFTYSHRVSSQVYAV